MYFLLIASRFTVTVRDGEPEGSGRGGDGAPGGRCEQHPGRGFPRGSGAAGKPGGVGCPLNDPPAAQSQPEGTPVK